MDKMVGIGVLAVLVAVIVLAFQSLMPQTTAQVIEKSAMERITSEGKLKICFMPWPPVMMKDPNTGAVSGESVDAVNIIAEEAGLKVEYIESTWGTFAAAIQAGQCDAAIGIFSTIQRATVLSFARPMFYTGNGVLVKAGETRFNSTADFDKPDVKIAVVQGEVGHLYVQKHLKNAQVIVLSGGDISLALAQVSAGKADAAFTDAWTIAQYAMVHNETMDFLDLHPEAAYGINPTTIAVKQTNTDLLNFFNTAILDLEVNGQLKELSQTYNTTWLRSEMVLEKS